MLNSKQSCRTAPHAASLFARKLAQVLSKILMGVAGTLSAVLLVAAGFLGHEVYDRQFGDAPPAQVASSAATASTGKDFGILGEIAKILGEDFVEPDKAQPGRLFDGAVEGLFSQLDDSHSTYISPEEYALQKSDFEGAFEGIGATVSKQGDWLVITQPLPGTPAERAGVKPGDTILTVDGESAQGWTVEQGVRRIRGPVGKVVKIGVRHADGKEEELSIQRASIRQASVSNVPPTGKVTDASGAEVTDYAYILIRSFTKTTPTEVKEALEAANKAGAKGIILDVRSNPGGLLSETIEIADMFLDKGEIISQVDRAGNKQTASAQRGVVTNLPVVVLQDQFSASGAEVLAAALKENGRAQVIGTRSFGKGTVNHLRDLSNGGAVYVSIARWLTAAGNQIEGQGVQPNIEVNVTQEDIQARRDIWMYRAVEVLRAAR